MSEAVVVNLFLVIRVTLVGGILLIFSRITRKGLLFGVYVGEEFADGDEGSRLLRSWDRGVLVLMAVSVLIGLAFSLVGHPVAGNLSGTGFLLLASFGLYLRTHSRVRPLIPPGVERQAELGTATLQSGIPRGETFAKFTFIACVLTALATLTYAIVGYRAMPDRVPSLSSPFVLADDLVTKSIVVFILPAVLNLLLSPVYALGAWLTTSAKLSVREGTDFRSAAAQMAFDTAPNRTMFALGINDGQDWCECDGCRDLFPTEARDVPAQLRWWSEPYWNFVNRVAVEVQKTHPEKRIGAIAYSNVARPPSFKLADTISVFVCHDAGSHFDERERTRETDYLDGWVSVCSDVGLYGYAGLASWIFPRYCRDELASNIRYASEHGIKRFYIENSWVKWIDGPLPWIVAQVLEDPTREPEALQRQFCNTAYGLAADAMDAYFDLLQGVWQSADHGKWFDGLYQIDEQARRYPPSVRAEMRAFIKDANELAMGNPAILRRIAAVSDPLVVAEAFATEDALMQQLREPIQSNVDLQTKEKMLPELRDAIARRNALLGTLDQYNWGPSVKKALAASSLEPTMDRWNRKQDTLIQNVENETRVMRNLLAGVPRSAAADINETGETP